jgi:hypothetical protein
VGDAFAGFLARKFVGMLVDPEGLAAAGPAAFEQITG